MVFGVPIELLSRNRGNRAQRNLRCRVYGSKTGPAAPLSELSERAREYMVRFAENGQCLTDCRLLFSTVVGEGGGRGSWVWLCVNLF